MLLLEPQPTSYDLKFNVGPIPVRVHPMFWLVAVFLGGVSQAPVNFVLIWVAVLFVSILIHELGHAVAALAHGWPPRVVLYSFGGLAIYSPTRRTHASSIGISFAGPAAGFVLAGITYLYLIVGGYEPSVAIGPATDVTGFPIFSFLNFHILLGAPMRNPNVYFVLYDLFYINLMWGFVNLLPIYPLDGGQIARELFVMTNRRDGVMQSLQLSLMCAVAMAAVGAMYFQSFYIAIMFGLLAYQNFEDMNRTRYGGGWY